MLGGFIDLLLQGFENRRVGLSDATLRSGDTAVQAFVVELYEKEVPRLEETVRLFETGMPDGVQRDIFATVDGLVRSVVLPAYARLARTFTIRERNDFYLLPEELHGLERFAWGIGGMALGGFVLWAPFIPIWQKEWVLVFVAGGLLFPDIRRYLALRRYESDLNGIVGHADAEILRTELAYLESGVSALGAPSASQDASGGRSPRSAAAERMRTSAVTRPAK
jgi:hypothetical protein